MTQEQFTEWYLSQPKICSYCGITVENLKKIPDSYNNKTHRMTIDRMDSFRDYELSNITLCCLRCNHIKGNFFTHSEMVEIGKTFISPKFKKYDQQI